MALYNPGAGQTDWRKQLKTSMQQPPAASPGGQMAGLGGTQQPQARTATTTQPQGQQGVYNAASSPSATSLNPDNINWGTQGGSTPVGSGGTPPNTSGSPANGYGYAQPAGQYPGGYTAQSRYGGYYNEGDYKFAPSLYNPVQDNWSSSDAVPDILSRVSDSVARTGEEYIASFARGVQPDNGMALNGNTNMGMTSDMREVYDAFGTLNIDNPQFYAGLDVQPGMSLQQFAGQYGLDASHPWVQNMYNNAMNPQINPTIAAGAADPNSGPNPNPEGPVVQEDNKKRRNNNNGNGHKNNGGGGGGNRGGNGGNGPHGGSGYGPQGMQGPGGGRPNNGNNNNGGGNKNNGGGKNNNNKKK
jgi:hypothetical protein